MDASYFSEKFVWIVKLLKLQVLSKLVDITESFINTVRVLSFPPLNR